MRQIATIPDPTEARAFADYLLSLEITTRLIPQKDGVGVWAQREDQLAAAKAEVGPFLADPLSERYQASTRKADEIRREIARRDKEHRRNTINLQGRLNVPSARRCPVTYILMALSIAITTWISFEPGGRLMWLLSFSDLSAVSPSGERLPLILTEEGYAAPQGSKFITTGLEGMRRGQVWRAVTPIFVHSSFFTSFGPLHLIFNMMWLYQLGGLIELRKGRLAMALLALSTAIASNFGQYYWELYSEGPQAFTLFGGMSGVVYALLGYVWMKSEYSPESDMKLPTRTLLWMLAWLVFCMTGGLGPIANAAHVVGLFSGMLIGLAPHLLGGVWRR